MIIMYIKPWCPFCEMAKNLLEENNISFEVRDIYSDEEKKSELFDESWMFTFPQIFVWNVKKDKLIWGFSELNNLEGEGLLQETIAKLSN